MCGIPLLAPRGKQGSGRGQQAGTGRRSAGGGQQMKPHRTMRNSMKSHIRTYHDEPHHPGVAPGSFLVALPHIACIAASPAHPTGA